MATERLYYADSWLASFTARVAGHGIQEGRPSVLLDRSAFYPEGGGQLADRGTIGDIAVVDVQVDADGVVHHVVEGEPPAVGAEVQAEIDRGFRRVNMSLHTGQHMLSRALLDVARAETMSSRLGANSCTIDLARAVVPEAELAEAVDLVNAVIDDDVEIRAWFPEPGELTAISLRRDPKVEDEIRVVQIGEFDASPCGGTHCTRTGQVGLVHISGLEKYKGMTRVWFDAGPRARREITAHSDWLRDIGRSLSAGPDGVADAVGKLRRELADARGAVKQLRLREAERTADSLQGDRVVAVIDGGVDVMRAVAKRITGSPMRVCLLATPVGDGTQIIAARGEQADFDCGAFVKKAATSAGGRGGGRPDHAEGRLPSGVDWPALAASVFGE